MVNFFVTQIRLGKVTLEDVPEQFRDAVAEMLKDA